MKIALFLSVVALVVGQPKSYPQPAPQPGTGCRLLSTPGNDLQCCRPDIFGGCDVAPGTFFPPGAPVPEYFRPPPGYLPSPNFLRAVCCPSGTECCPTEVGAVFPEYECCDTSTQECAINEDDNTGSCQDSLPAGNYTSGTTFPADSLDPEGRCPDGTLPIQGIPGKIFRCTLNKFLPQGQGCPANHACVKDRSGNINSGVCCRSTECEGFTTCTDCASAGANGTFGVQRAGCSWLTQGDLYDNTARCVANCQNFPGSSCIVGGLPADIASTRCPLTDANPNGTNFNTGSCNRRCGLVGTGRSSRITNGTEINNRTNANPCCQSFPGDACCDSYGQLQPNCAFGRVIGGPICGVPIQGTPWRLPQGYYGSPFPQPPIPTPFFAREVAEAAEGSDVDYAREIGEQASDDARYFYVRPPYPYNPYQPFYAPVPPPPRYQPPPIDQRPSQFICSCDAEAVTKYNDACEDYATYCVNSTAVV